LACAQTRLETSINAAPTPIFLQQRLDHTAPKCQPAAFHAPDGHALVVAGMLFHVSERQNNQQEIQSRKREDRPCAA
jgi:hypothetical protein